MMKHWLIFLGSVASALCGCAMARMPHGIDGSWIIADVELAPISAVGVGKARALLRRDVRISPDRIQFADRICIAPIRTPSVESDERLISITCSNKTIIPNFRIGTSGVRASLDGVTYILKRKR